MLAPIQTYKTLQQPSLTSLKEYPLISSRGYKSHITTASILGQNKDMSKRVHTFAAKTTPYTNIESTLVLLRALHQLGDTIWSAQGNLIRESKAAIIILQCKCICSTVQKSCTYKKKCCKAKMKTLF